MKSRLGIPRDHIQLVCHLPIIKSVIELHKIRCHRAIRSQLLHQINLKFHKNPPFSTPYYFTNPFHSGAHRPLTRSKKKDGNLCVERGKQRIKKSKYNTYLMCCTYFTTNTVLPECKTFFLAICTVSVYIIHDEKH